MEYIFHQIQDLWNKSPKYQLVAPGPKSLIRSRQTHPWDSVCPTPDLARQSRTGTPDIADTGGLGDGCLVPADPYGPMSGRNLLCPNGALAGDWETFHLSGSVSNTSCLGEGSPRMRKGGELSRIRGSQSTVNQTYHAFCDTHCRHSVETLGQSRTNVGS